MDLPDIDILDRSGASGIMRRAQAIPHIISISDRGHNPPKGYNGQAARKMKLDFDDIPGVDVVDVNAPSIKHVKAILEFAQDIKAGEYVLIHCNAGISRSSAAALCVIASKLPPSHESAMEAVTKLMQIKQIIHPNHRMVRFADALLRYNGALESAYKSAFGGGDLIDWGKLQSMEEDLND